MTTDLNNCETVNTTMSNDTISDVIQVSRDTKETFNLFMAHKTQYACQKSAISNLYKHLKDECIKGESSKKHL